jgi:hypothetical protein
MPDLVITPPPLAAPRTGLLTTAADLTPADSHWTGGITWRPEPCPHASARADVCAPGQQIELLAGAPSGIRAHRPIVVTADEQCSAISEHARAVYEARALRALFAVQSFAAARELWAGPVAQQAGFTDNLWLTKAGVAQDLTPAGGPASISRALDILEQGLAEHGLSGGRGAIHLPIAAIPFIGVTNLGSTVVTVAAGTPLIADGGYPGTGPGDTTPAAGTAWAYATGRPFSAVSEPWLIPGPNDPLAAALDRTDNTFRFVAERYVLATWDSCWVGAVHITLGA